MKQTLKAAKSSDVKNEPKKHVKNEPTMLIMLIMLKLNGTQFHRILVCGGADDKYKVSQIIWVRLLEELFGELYNIYDKINSYI